MSGAIASAAVASAAPRISAMAFVVRNGDRRSLLRGSRRSPPQVVDRRSTAPPTSRHPDALLETGTATSGHQGQQPRLQNACVTARSPLVSAASLRATRAQLRTAPPARSAERSGRSPAMSSTPTHGAPARSVPAQRALARRHARDVADGPGRARRRSIPMRSIPHGGRGRPAAKGCSAGSARSTSRASRPGSCDTAIPAGPHSPSAPAGPAASPGRHLTKPASPTARPAAPSIFQRTDLIGQVAQGRRSAIAGIHGRPALPRAIAAG